RSISDIIDLSSTTDSDTSGPNIDTTDNSDSGEALNLTELITPEPTYLPNTRSRPSTRLKRPVPRLADASILPDLSNNPDNDIDEDIINVPLDYRRLEQTKDDLVEALREVTPNNTRITAEDSEEINIIELPLKREVEGYYIFYKIEVINRRTSIFAYRFRYREGKILNESSANVINGRESNKSLIRAITQIKQRASLRKYLEYIEATRRIKEQAEEYKYDPSIAIQSRLEKLTRETSNTFGRLERVLRRKLLGAAINDEEAKKRRSGKEGTLPWLRSPDTMVSLKVGYYIGDVNGLYQVTGSIKNRPAYYQS
ncbi:hypothetical protein N7516_004751, partial [Penicillium verrucosum]|uniref:uncharacterized protein n=1 Tax=Penicillium verrucosum TaxID=60171 RepID=UPI0025455196